LKKGEKVENGLSAKEQDTMQTYHTARLYSMNQSIRKRSYQYNSISQGKVVYFLADNDLSGDFLDTSADGSGEFIHLAVCHVLGRTADQPWIVGYLLKENEENFHTSKNLKLVKLDNNIRTAGQIHVCDSECQIRSKSDIHHSKTILQGGKYIIMKRIEGFPPHLG